MFKYTCNCFKENFNIKSSKNIYELNKLAQINKMNVSFSALKRREEPVYTKHTPDNFSGCMLGSAIGDAMGKPVEYANIDTIRETYGRKGITDLVVNENGVAEVSEDTQLSMFTADGIIKSALRFLIVVFPSQL